jgi:hypothetical protein
MKSTALRFIVTLGMISGIAFAMPPAEVNAQTTNRGCVRNSSGRCVRTKIGTQPTRSRSESSRDNRK